MIVITEQPESKLVEWFEESRNDAEHSPRAIYIKAFPELFDHTLGDLSPPILLYLTKQFQDSDVRLFRLYDDDIVIAGKGIGTRHFRTLINYFTADYGQEKHCAHFFERGSNWHQFERLVRVKREEAEVIAQQEEQHARALKQQKQRFEALNQQFPEVLLETIDSRRMARAETEIMLVEDDLFSRTLVARSLNGHGNLTGTEDGKNAIAAYVHKAPDILFLDLDLPDINGHDVLAKILELDPNAYIVMLSANGDQANVLTCMKNGAQGFVAKPFNKEKLLHYINQAPTSEAPAHEGMA